MIRSRRLLFSFSSFAGSGRTRTELHRGVRPAVGHSVQEVEARRELRGAGHIVQGRLRDERPRERAHMHLGPDHRQLPMDAGRSPGAGHESPAGPGRRHLRVAGHVRPRPDGQALERDHR